MSVLLYRIGRFAAHRAKVVLGAWVALLAVLVGLLLGVGSSLDSAFTIPGSPSQTALDRLEQLQPAAAGSTGQIVFVAPQGKTIADADVKTVVERTMAAAAKAPEVAAVVDPYQSQSISPDGTTALGQALYPKDAAELQAGTTDALKSAVTAAEADGVRVEVGGTAFATRGVQVGATEMLGVVVALLVIAITFGSLVAAGLPLLTAIVGVGIGLVGLLLVSNLTTVSSTAPTLALMIGLAVGIDYALFILSRHRSQLAGGLDPKESAARANGTAGSAVVFAGVTVMIALAGLSVVDIPFLTVMGLAAAATVAVAVLIAVTAVPALAGLLGGRLAPKEGSRAQRRELALARPDDDASGHGSFGERWIGGVTRHPAVVAVLGIVLLGLIAVPAKDLRLALPDNGSAPASSSERQAYDLISEKFGPGANGPLLVLADLTGSSDPTTALAGVVQQIQGQDDVAAVQPTSDPVQGTAILSVVPKSGPDDEATTTLVKELRAAAPAIREATGAEISVTGTTAVQIDVSDRLSSSLVPFALVVVGLALILLLLVFRSIVVPVKAAAGFLLSVAASLGAVTAVFEWGWLDGLLGVEQTGPVVSFFPVILIGVLFGLAMDYEVFLVSRMREEYVHGAAPKRAVVVGGRHAARVVTAAAIIMFAVFASFVFTDDATIKPIALGLAVGVAFDAFVVRMTLVPAVLALVGRAAWWLPKWLDRILPDLDVEGARLDRATGVLDERTPEDAVTR